MATNEASWSAKPILGDALEMAKGFEVEHVGATADDPHVQDQDLPLQVFLKIAVRCLEDMTTCERIAEHVRRYHLT